VNDRTREQHKDDQALLMTALPTRAPSRTTPFHQDDGMSSFFPLSLFPSSVSLPSPSYR